MKRFAFQLVPDFVWERLIGNDPYLRHFVYDQPKAPYRAFLEEVDVKHWLYQNGFSDIQKLETKRNALTILARRTR